MAWTSLKREAGNERKEKPLQRNEKHRKREAENKTEKRNINGINRHKRSDSEHPSCDIDKVTFTWNTYEKNVNLFFCNSSGLFFGERWRDRFFSLVIYASNWCKKEKISDKHVHKSYENQEKIRELRK